MTIPLAILFAGATIGAAIFLSTLFQMYVANKALETLFEDLQRVTDNA